MGRDDGIGYCPTCGRKAEWVTLDAYGGCEVHGRGPVDWNRPRPAVEIRDLAGNLILRGQRVVDEKGRDFGTVVALVEQHGEYDDAAGRDVGIGPFVDVEYDDGGDTLRWNAEERYDRSGNPTGFVCDEVEVKEES